MKQFRISLFLVVCLLTTAALVRPQHRIMQIHSAGGVVYEVNTAQVDSVVFRLNEELPKVKCEFDNPLTDLPWLKDIIAEFEKEAEAGNEVYAKIYQCTYKDGTGFLIEPRVGCPNVGYVLTSCEGNSLCLIGGLLGDVCTEYRVDFENKKLIWEMDTDAEFSLAAGTSWICVGDTDVLVELTFSGDMVHIKSSMEELGYHHLLTDSRYPDDYYNILNYYVKNDSIYFKYRVGEEFDDSFFGNIVYLSESEMTIEYGGEIPQHQPFNFHFIRQAGNYLYGERGMKHFLAPTNMLLLTFALNCDREAVCTLFDNGTLQYVPPGYDFDCLSLYDPFDSFILWAEDGRQIPPTTIEYYKASDEVVSAACLFRSWDGKAYLGLSNKIFLTLKPNTPYELFQKLAKKNNFTFEPIGSTPGDFLMKMPKTFSLNALQMANLICKTGLFEHVQPSFTQIRPLELLK